MKVYISGKIGEEILSEATIAKFKKAEDMLREKGHEPFNPCSEVWQAYLSLSWVMLETRTGMDKYAYYLLEDQKKLAECDAVLFLDDTHDSPGATSEYYFSLAIRKWIMFTNKEQAKTFLTFKWIDLKDRPRMTLEEAGDVIKSYIQRNIDNVWLPL